VAALTCGFIAELPEKVAATVMRVKLVDGQLP
jgi:hypothetical protein